MPPPLKLTTESFVFNNSPYKRTSNVSTHKKKKKTAAGKVSRPQHQLKASTPTSSAVTTTRSEQQQQTLPVLAQVAKVLQGRCIYIEKKLHDYATLRELADAMGAHVKESMDKTVTDYITDLKSGKKQLGATANKGNRCVSPLWLVTCYQQQRYLPPINFPIDLQTHINTFPAVAAPPLSATTTTTAAATTTSEIVDDDDNPFGLEEVDYDLLETRKPGYQFKMDGYVTRNRASEENDVVSSDAETVRIQDEEEEDEDEDEDEGEEAQREFYYNQSSDSTAKKRREESVEEIEARKKRNNEIRLKLSKAKSSATTSSNSSKSAGSSSRIMTRSTTSSQKEASTGFFGQQKFSVWYGEQEFEHVTSNKRS